ncbi:MAG: hypothetical protein ACKVOR_13255 [Flavobacteriales bacterium]
MHLKKNHFLLLIWAFLFSIVTGVMAMNIGVPQQFLVPEYRGGTGFISYYILGFAVGGFITGFNLFTYIMHGFRFPFIATMSRPFQKFSLNNFILPSLFILTYLICSARFQHQKELIPAMRIVFNLFSFLFGIVCFQALSYLYFLYTNKEAHVYGKRQRRKQKKEDNIIDSPIHQRFSWLRRRAASSWHVETYMSSFNKISLARESHHYSKEVLEKVFSQNHINASRFELVLVISFLLIGSLRSFEIFVIPAAASCMLFFTMLLMIVSAVHSWLRGWTLTVFVLLLIGLNYFYKDLKLIRIESRAIGLNYDVPPAQYDLRNLKPSEQTVAVDVQSGLQLLNNRLSQMTAMNDSTEKPKLVIINTSGGGSRSAFWTMRAMAYADSMCGGKLMNQCVLVTGASGGMLGAAYMRELYMRQQWGEIVNPYDTVYAENMAMDLLNTIILSTATNDWFIRYQKVHDGDQAYTKDRATAFEEQLRRNTANIFDRRLRDYKVVEFAGQTPMMILSPTIVNDGRRLIISAQPVSYLTQAFHVNGEADPLPEDVEFSRMFARQGADNLQFVTALRMNATFPYVFPMTILPSEPPVEVLDAGVRDNFGMKTSLQFIYTFKDWINENTSGVVIVQIRDLPKNVDFSDHEQSLFGNFSAPIGGIYGNITKTHDYNSEQMLRYAQGWFNNKVDLISFQLHQEREDHISLNWHLTRSEKKHIRDATRDAYFQQELKRLQLLLK